MGVVILLTYVIASSVQNSQSLPLNCEIYIGPNCNIEYRSEGKEVSSCDFAELAFLYIFFGCCQRRFLAAFADIQGISYEAELISRGKIILDLRSNPVCDHVVILALASEGAFGCDDHYLGCDHQDSSADYCDRHGVSH